MVSTGLVFSWGWDVVFPPLFYAFHGWFATEMAIWMLFRPYYPKYLPGVKEPLPFTPGVFPRGKARLATAVASTVAETLLTPADLQFKAREMATKDNVYQGVSAILDAIISQFSRTDSLHRLAEEIAEWIPLILDKTAHQVVNLLSREGFLESAFDKVLHQAILNFQLTPAQSSRIMNWLFDRFFTPEQIRLAVIGMLTDENIQALEQTILSRISFGYRLLYTVAGMDQAPVRLREFLEKEPAAAEEAIADILLKAQMREKLAHHLSEFTPRKLSWESVQEIERETINWLRRTVILHREDIEGVIQRGGTQLKDIIMPAITNLNLAELPPERLETIKQEVTHFSHDYLHRKLEELLAQALKAVNIEGMIIEKINHYTPQQVENLLQRIVKKELKALAYLGGFIGLWLGFVQVFITFFRFGF